MAEIGQSLGAGSDRKSLRHRTMTEPGDLGEDEPHPVGLLPALAQFGEYPRIDRRLRVDKALQIETIGHDAGLAPGWLTSSARRSSSSRWPSRIFSRATGRSNQPARSISGNACILPPFGGHSISKVLLFTVCTSMSPSTVNASTRLPPRWRTSHSDWSGP